MPIFKADWKQIVRLIKVFSEDLLPLWRVTLPERLRGWNSIAVFVVVVIAALIFETSVFPSDVQYYDREGHLMSGTGGIGMNLVYLKVFVSLAVMFLVCLSFLIDLKDFVADRVADRFLYEDLGSTRDTALWWSLMLLFLGYLLRLWVFGAVAMLGISAANICSVASSGLSITLGSSSAISTSTSQAFFLALQNPLGAWAIDPGGSWASYVFVCVFAIFRWILLTFLVGSFSLILRRLSEHLRQPAPASNAS